jgi:hypothetical protein
MTTISKNSQLVTFINVFTVEPARQMELVGLLARATEIVRLAPGFISASLHRGVDGTKVTMCDGFRKIRARNVRGGRNLHGQALCKGKPMMNRIGQIALAVVLAGVSLAAWAAPGINGCVTPEGHPLYGDDTARNECRDSPIQRLNPDGSKMDPIPAPLTPEQRKAKGERERKLIECSMRNRDQKRKDDALQGRYPSEDDLQDARYDALGKQLRRVNEANDSMKEIIARGKELTEKGRFFAPRHRMPASLQADREANYGIERSQIHTIEDAAHEIQRINDLYDADLKRYRELVNGTAAMPCNGRE